MNSCHHKSLVPKKETPSGWRRLFLPVFGLLSTAWLLVRIIPKPSRATYPCMKVAAPIASTFVAYLTGLTLSAFSFKRLRLAYRKNQFKLVLLFFILLVTGISWIVLQTNTDSVASSVGKFPDAIDPLGANNPIGVARGIYPGRVVWAHDPGATNENCTNEVGDGYFLEKNVDAQAIEAMMQDVVLNVTGESTIHAAWQALFAYFNQRHNKDNLDYQTGETIFIKLNEVGTANDSQGNMSTQSWRYQSVRTSPETVLALLRQLITDYGIPQNMIFVGDPKNQLANSWYTLWHSEFPDVNYVDSKGGQGRTKTDQSGDPVIFYSDRGKILRAGTNDNGANGPPVYSDAICGQLERADYLINFSVMKAHARAGISVCAKNHFGTHNRSAASHLHMGLVSPNMDPDDAFRQGYGLYRVLVDMTSHEKLGGNTLLFLADGLWSSSEATDPPRKFSMAPFNDDYTSSILASQDQVALESVCYDILKTEFTQTNPFASWPNMQGVDDYLHQAADSEFWPDSIAYDPENDGTVITSQGVHEHWDNADNMAYTRNLETGEGIELIRISNNTSAVEKIPAKTVDDFSMVTNYPNPFNPSTTIQYQIPQNGHVELFIYQANGQLVNRLIRTEQSLGSYQLKWNGRSNTGVFMPSGIYFLRLALDDRIIAESKMMLLK